MSSHRDLLATVASLYYTLNQSQSAIAKRLDISNSTVSRLLKEARDKGVVDIRINMPIPRDVELEQELINVFGLRDAYVLQTSGDGSWETRTDAIGQLAANYIERMLERFPVGSSVGAAWGRGVYAAVMALPDHAAQNINAVPLIGGVGTLAIDSPDVTRIIAQKLGGRHHDLPAPILVERPEVRDMLLQEPSVQVGIQRANDVHMAILGIGTVVDEASSFLRSGLLSTTDLARLRAEGIVGEICGYFYDIHGEYQPYEINRRTIGLELKQLREIEIVLAVAYGLPKVEAIYGALQGGYLNVLVTDDQAANGLLDMAKRN